MNTFHGKVLTGTKSNQIKTDANVPGFGSLDPKAITSMDALSGTNGTLADIGNGSHALIIKNARKELIAEGDSSRELKAGSHLEKVAKVYTLEATDEIHLKSQRIVIEAQQISLFNGKDFVDIKPGHVTIKGARVDVNPEQGGYAQGTPAVPTSPGAAG